MAKRPIDPETDADIDPSGQDTLEQQQAREFGAALRAARLDQGISQRQLAKDTGVHFTKITRIENGEIDLRMSTARRLANYLRIVLKTVVF